MLTDVIGRSGSWLGPLLTVIAVVLYGVVHSLLASARAKAAAHQNFGAAATRYYRIVYNILGRLTFLPVLVIVARFPGNTLYQIPWPWLVFFVLGQYTAIILLIVGF